MASNSLFPLIAGTVVTTLAVIVFLFSLQHGLKRGKWMPLVIITSFWLLGMVLYAFSASQNMEGSPRQRIGTDF